MQTSRARDSILIRTSYKSPSSVHIFSFSTDDSDLFPKVPEVAANTIRTQTVIQGWSLEALSPTTTQITLIEQTDSRGWSNKSWTYNHMISSVAGVGDFAIKSGSPPVLSRLSGAKATLSKYDHEKGSLKLEYHGLSETVTPPTPGLSESPRSSITATLPTSSASIECELRCDIDVWSSGLDIVTDPPPTRVSCLSRHRLASGGGCWITIEHDAASIGTDPLLVLVRRGPATRAKGSVFVNGAKIKVDTESLGNDAVKVLSAQKRIKASPVPLDQWPSANGSATSRSVSPQPVSTSTAQLSTSDTVREHLMPTVSAVTQLGEFVASATSPAVVSNPLRDDLPQMCYALEALAWAQSFHAEQGPDIAACGPGWLPVADKVGLVRKKVVAAISESLSVYRGDKVVEGLKAEQIMSVVSSSSLRTQWDERMDSSTTLETYGDGCSTSLLTTKPASLIFRGRALYVASTSAEFQVPSSSAASSTSTVHIHAAASCPPSDAFDKAKTNAADLPVGRLLFEAWILETVDPYTNNTHPIPSTRCTYLSCIDWAGSVPLSFRPFLHTSPIRIIDAVERCAKQHATPRCLQPSSSFEIEGPLAGDALDECFWSLSSLPPPRAAMCLLAEHRIASCTFRLVLQLASLDPEALSSHARSSSQPLPRTRPAHMLRSPASSASLLTKALQSSSGSVRNMTLDSKPIDNNKSSASTAMATVSETSVTNNVSSAITLPSAKVSTPADLLVAELLVTPELFEGGYQIRTSAQRSFGLPDQPAPLSATSFGDDSFPFQAIIRELPPDEVVDASAGGKPSRRHLLQVTLPTRQFTHPVEDPLRDKPNALPSWYRRLQRADLLVQVLISAQGESAVAANNRVPFNGTPIPVADKDARRPVDLPLPRALPKISRCDNRTVYSSCLILF